MSLDELERRLLTRVQQDFPIAPRPFERLGAEFGMSETEAFERVRSLTERGFIREMGAVFDLRKLGYTSTLCAAEVDADALENVAARINEYSEITHNYLRENRWNVWFTVIAQSPENIEKILNDIRAAAGVRHVISLPARRMFKIKVHFQAEGGGQ